MHSAFQAGDLEAAESQMPQHAPQGKAATFGLSKESSPAVQDVGHFVATAFYAVNVSSSIRATMKIREL